MKRCGMMAAVAAMLLAASSACAQQIGPNLFGGQVSSGPNQPGPNGWTWPGLARHGYDTSVTSGGLSFTGMRTMPTPATGSNFNTGTGGFTPFTGLFLYQGNSVFVPSNHFNFLR